MDSVRLDIQSLLEAYRNKKTKPSEVAEAYLKRAESKAADLGVYLDLRRDDVLKRAAELDARAADAAKLPLYGVPVAIKDIIHVRGLRTTAGSKILNNYVAPYSATCVEKLEAAGAIAFGKASCDEFAMGSSNEHSAYGPVKNPWDTSRVPGGSSGGSAAAVAAHQALGALGTDTGGSIRQPASLCGVVGIKPTYGRVSRYGVVAYASSLDQVGPFGRTVWDAARLLEAISGYDGKDSTSSRGVVPSYTERLSAPSLKGVVVGVAREWLEGADAEVLAAFENSLALMRDAGAKLVDIKLPHSEFSLSTYYILAPCEASSNLARYDGVHYGHRTASATTSDSLYLKSRGEGFGKEVKLRIMLGTYALSAGYYDAYYLKANRVRRMIQADFENAFQSCQVIASPTSPTTAFRLGEKQDDPLQMYLSDVYTLPVNLAGLPGVSVPCGLDSKQLPMGLQLIGKWFDEGPLLEAAAAYEQSRGAFPLSPVAGRAL